MPTTDDTSEYVVEYIKYKTDKTNTLLNQMKKLYSHIQKAEKTLKAIVEKENI